MLCCLHDVFTVSLVRKGKNITCSHHCLTHLCKQKSNWVQCMCPPGMEFNAQRQCVDIDECVTTPHVCSQTCQNTPRSYKCSCVNGYEMTNFGQCKLKGNIGRVFLFLCTYVSINFVNKSEECLISSQYIFCYCFIFCSAC